jgi:predicted ribosome quality control (RQC) complex YloA/Tae2 family protein
VTFTLVEMKKLAEDENCAGDKEDGIWASQRVARRFVSPDGFVILVGRTASDNDLLTFKIASPNDFWLHVAAESGSHVVVRNPDGVDSLPRETLRFAAALAARYSRARRGGKVAVHVTRRSEVRKPRGLPPGKVTISHFKTVHATPIDEESKS